VLVTRAGPGFVPSVAELALGFMVDLSRGISRATADYHSGRAPEVVMGRQLAGSRLGIIGYGSIGKFLAPIALALGMEVLVADPFATVNDARIRHLSLEDLLERSDYVVCLAIANESTENLIGKAELARMRSHAFFINLSRGNLVDEAALAAVLRENRIAGAAMDVGRALDQMPSPELAKLPNVIATPHIGGLTPPAIESQSSETVRQVEAIIDGEVPMGAVKPIVGNVVLECRPRAGKNCEGRLNRSRKTRSRQTVLRNHLNSTSPSLLQKASDAASLLLRLDHHRGDVRHHGDRRQCAHRVFAVLSADHR
jgi:D-3-phosphoglycerate dehydrogenase